MVTCIACNKYLPCKFFAITKAVTCAHDKGEIIFTKLFTVSQFIATSSSNIIKHLSLDVNDACIDRINEKYVAD